MAQRVEWKDWEGTAKAGGLMSSTIGASRSYAVYRKRNSKFYVEASRKGGAKVRLPYQEFESIEDAKAWVEDEERRQAEFAARAANDPKIIL